MPKTRSGDVDVGWDVEGEGTPILLVQGLGGVGLAWGLVADRLVTTGHRVATLDNRGVGDTFMARGVEWTVHDMADDVLAVADALNWDTFHIAGLSMGGMIAQDLLVRAPERLRSAALLATGPGLGDHGPDRPSLPLPDPEALAVLAQPFDKDDPAGSSRRMIGALCGPGFAHARPDRVGWMIEVGVRKPVPARGYTSQMQAIGGFSVWAELPGVTVPTLVVHGDSDPLLPVENGRALADRIPGARYVELPGDGHMLFLEAPEHLAHLLDDHTAAAEAAVSGGGGGGGC